MKRCNPVVFKTNFIRDAGLYEPVGYTRAF